MYPSELSERLLFIDCKLKLTNSNQCILIYVNQLFINLCYYKYYIPLHADNKL